MEELIRVENLTRRFTDTTSSVFHKQYFTAVDSASFSIFEGETLGLLGESGCGKSTIARMLSGLIEPDSGKIFYRFEDITSRVRSKRREIQMIFQNPFSALDPRMSVKDALLEPLNLWHIGCGKKERIERIKSMIAECGLEQDTLNKYPMEFSGGQLQRIAIARALLSEPHFLIADEIVSALDVSVQARILALLDNMKARYGLTVLFISHDLFVIRSMCDRAMVMKQGKILECGSCARVLDTPQNEYIDELKESVFPL